MKAAAAAALPLLEAGEPVEAVGDRVGISNPAAFRRQFRRVMGVAPSARRQSFADGPPGTVSG